MPAWARGIAETADLVQDAMVHAFKRLDRFEVRRKGALQAYLRQSIQNRIRDELRAFNRRPRSEEFDEIEPIDQQPSPLDLAIDEEARRRYLDALQHLRPLERELIVGRLELGYSYEQLAAATDRPSPQSARVAVRRALMHLAEEMKRV
jgi:RNA polymerase sigma-70 factor (ECF subfamily)